MFKGKFFKELLDANKEFYHEYYKYLDHVYHIY